MSLSTRPVMAPLDTISRRDSSDMVRPSGKRSSCASTSKRAIEVLNSLRRRWLRMLSILTEQPEPQPELEVALQGRRRRVRDGRCCAVATGANSGSCRFDDGLVHAEYPSDDQGADAGAAADIKNLAGDEGRFAAGE